MDEMTLDRLLTRSAETTVYPPTPRLRARVATLIAAPSRPARGGIQSLALAVAALCIAAAALLTLALPPSREAIADFFGIEGSRIERLPTSAPGVASTPFPTPRVVDDLATPVALDDITAAAGFEPALPLARTPERAYVAHYGAIPAVIISYSDFDLWQVRANGDFEGLFQKGVPTDTQILDVAVGGRPARWITGGPHLVGFYDGQRALVEGSIRTVARSTLIWRTDVALYRIETSLALDEATSIAESLP